MNNVFIFFNHNLSLSRKSLRVVLYFKILKNKLLKTTSIPIDFHLLSGDLLETHTGKLKDKHKLNTKFKPIPNVDLSNIPFNQTTHRIFGDNTLIAPLPMPLRREVIEVSLKKKWNTHTSEELIKEQTKSILK